MPRRVRTLPKRIVPEETPQKEQRSGKTKKMQEKTPPVNPPIEKPTVPPYLQEIRRLQASTNHQIPKLPFARVIREVLMGFESNDKNLRITVECLECLQEAAEMYLALLFEDSYLCCLHRDRVTLTPKDMKLALFLRERF